MESTIRETVKFTLPTSKDIIECYTYITGKENRVLGACYSDEKVNKNDIYVAAQDLGFRTVIVSINGKKQGEQITPSGGRLDVVEFLLALRKSDYQFAVDKINAIIADKAFESEKKVSPAPIAV